MGSITTFDDISTLLTERYADAGRSAARRLQRWLSGEIWSTYPKALQEHVAQGQADLLFDAFWQVLPFGTGGRRGRVGYGSNRVNPTTIALTVQGHCDYLRSAFSDRDDLGVVVANDVRVFHDIAQTYHFLPQDHPLLGVSSRLLAKLACEIYAANGIKAYMKEPRDDKAVMTTPELSYLIGVLEAAGGINLSASHNHPDDNGIKIYDEYGGQPVAPHDQTLTDFIEDVTTIQTIPFEQALDEEMVLNVPAELHEGYITTYVKLYERASTSLSDSPIVYTPLCGAGLTSVGEVLERLGFALAVPPNEGPDGTFSAIPFKAPNPEVPQATSPARAFADTQGSRIVLSSDPDADRVGLEVKLDDGSWYHFDGQQIATVLCYFLMLDPLGPRRKGLVIETLVTTKIFGKIVEKAEASWLIDDLLVGFKYVAHALDELERTGRYGSVQCSPKDLVLAAEESHGVMVVPSIREKDATPACMYLAGLDQRLQEEGRTLFDYYIQILEELGGYAEIGRSIMLSGAKGVLLRDKVMAWLRRSPPQELAGYPVTSIEDHWDQDAFGPFVSETDKLPRNVLQIFTEAFIITVRPSGTEPKVKFYCQLLPTGSSDNLSGYELFHRAKSDAERVSGFMYNELLTPLGLRLGEVGLFLPDIIELDRKLHFEQHTVEQLREALAQRRFTGLDDLLGWLRQRTASMTPGADPLPALQRAITYLCEQWIDDEPFTPLLAELREWASR